MVHGCIRIGFRWVADGGGIAVRRGMKASRRRKKICRTFAIWDMPRLVRGCRRSGPGILFGLQLEAFSITRRMEEGSAFNFGTCASAGTVRRSMDF